MKGVHKSHIKSIARFGNVPMLKMIDLDLNIIFRANNRRTSAREFVRELADLFGINV